MEAKDLFSEVKQIPIQSVLGRYMNLRKTGSIYEGLCPFHGDEHMGSFKVNPSKHRFNCYVCGAYGDAVDFVAQTEGCTKTQAVVMIAKQEGLISSAEADELLAGKTLKGKTVKKKPIKVIPENTPQPPEHCAAVYTAFVEACAPLSKDHIQHLREVRKIPEADMDLFFEWPNSEDKEFWIRFEEKLREHGLTCGVVNAVKFVPGFAFDNEAETPHPYFMNGQGIGIKLFDKDGVLRGLQLRQDNAKKGAKYKLFSSGWAAKNSLDEQNKWDGASAGQVPDIVYPRNNVKHIAITEGKFKALALRRFGYATLSVNGVNSWAMVLPEIIAVAKENGITECHIYYDADSATNEAVAKAARSLANGIKANGLTPYQITWDQSLGKGIDDMLLAGHKNALKKNNI